jgi:SAM-dependent methyltransferase
MRDVAGRIAWAVELLDIQPESHVLEIGGGAGHAAALILPQLAGGTYTGLDRSPAMTAQAMKRNQLAVESGRATFVVASVEDAVFDADEFDRIFLVNVNLHLHQPGRDLANIRSWLTPGGTFVAVSHPPVERKALEYAAQVPELLSDAGFGPAKVATCRLEGGLAAAVIARNLASPF